jgi:DNA-binding IclR family transcriptional regulator
LSKHPEGITIADISRETGIHRNTVSKYIFGLAREGVAHQRKIGVVSLCFLKKNYVVGVERGIKKSRRMLV